MAKSQRQIGEFRIAAWMSPDDVDGVKEINTLMVKLRERRKSQISISGPLKQSKLAWKISTYQQPVLYRIVMLTEGMSLNWNFGNILCCLLAARALIETIALLLEFETELTDLIKKEDIGACDALLMNRLFASRDGKLISGMPETRAINALTFVDKLDKRLLPGLRGHYDFLSERCHPNSFGHHQLFGRLDKNTGTTTYLPSGQQSGFLVHILCAAPLLGLAELSISSLDQAVATASKLQNEQSPLNWDGQLEKE